MIQEEGLGRRERNRLQRHGTFLAAALRIATTDGLDAVTMQRLAADLDCAVGTVYTYFPSKGALVAEVQRAAIDRLTASLLLLGAETEALLEGETDPVVAALTHVVAVGRFGVDSVETYPQESRLLQLLMTAAGTALTTDEASRVVPAALRFLDLVRARMAAATDAGALGPGDPMDRTVIWAAANNGVLQVGGLARFDTELLDGRRLALAMVDDLLTGWGADLGALARAHAHVATLARRGSLARPLPEGS